LIDDGRTTSLLGAGDPVGAARIAAIEPDGVVLNDGRRLVLAPPATATTP
jgi:hypothetical protein